LKGEVGKAKLNPNVMESQLLILTWTRKSEANIDI